MADKIWARKQNGIIIEVFPPLPEDVVPGKDVFPDDWEYVDVTDVKDVAAGWRVQLDGSVTPPPVVNPPAADILAYANTKQESLLASVWEFEVGAAAKPTTRLNDKGQAAMLQLLVWAKMLAKPGDTQHYNQADGSAGPDLTAVQATNLAGLAGLLKTQTIGLLNEVDGKVKDGSIVTFHDVDALAWPVPKETA